MGQGGRQSVGEGLAWYWVTEVRVRSILEGKYIESILARHSGKDKSHSHMLTTASG